MNDLISRQAAIAAVGEVHPLDFNGQAILNNIKKIPSVNMSDLISRKGAIYSIVNTPSGVDDNKTLKDKYDGAAFRQDEIIDIIESLPPAQQWIPVSRGLPEEGGGEMKSDKLCKDCPHFHVRCEYRDIYTWGIAECEKHNLVTDFRSKKKFETLSCIEQEDLEAVR